MFSSSLLVPGYSKALTKNVTSSYPKLCRRKLIYRRAPNYIECLLHHTHKVFCDVSKHMFKRNSKCIDFFSDFNSHCFWILLFKLMSWWMAIGITISNWNPLKTIFQKLFLVWLNSYKRYFSDNSTVLQRHMLRNNQSKLWYDWSSIVNNFLHFKDRNVLKNMKKAWLV